MTAVLSAPDPDATANQLCDWIELCALFSPTRRARVSEINAAREIGEDFDYEDSADEDVQREDTNEQVFAALGERSSAMAATYPFETDGSSTVRVKDEISPGGYAYLFCLLVSNSSKSGILFKNPPFCLSKSAFRDAYRLFQVCATTCAAGWLDGGMAFSFGFPRPDKSSFHQKILSVYKQIGDGEPHRTLPVYGPIAVKDDSIDVIAYKREIDGRPGGKYILGQSAAGEDWRGKSIKAFIDVFHETWFYQRPAAECMPAIMIPFVLPSAIDATTHVSQAQIEGEFWRHTRTFGMVFYRYRLVLNIDRAIDAHEKGASPIEDIDRLPQIKDFVEKHIAAALRLPSRRNET